MLSAIAVTFNNENVIERFLKSVDFADEIIIIDNGSTDSTLTIAEKHHVKVITKELDSLDAQYRSALKDIKNDWILFLNVHDHISIELSEEIKNKIQQNKTVHALKIKSEFYFMGQQMKFGGHKNKATIKVVRNDHFSFGSIFNTHPFTVKGKTETLKLGYKDWSYVDFDSFNQSLTEISKSRAQLLFDKKIRPNLYHLLLKPFGCFLGQYVLKFGLLDGKKGFILTYLIAFAEFKCYLYLWLNYRNID